jgi:hypothetical protein
MSLHAEGIGDLLTGTLRHLGRFKFNQIATRIQHYEAFSRIMRKQKVQFDDGVGIQRTIMTDHSGAARQTELFDTDEVSVQDVLTTMNVPWRHTTTNFAYEKREMMMNRGSSRIVSLIKARRADCMIGLAEHMEDEFWRDFASATEAADDKRVFSLPYWITYHDYGETSTGADSVAQDGDDHPYFSSGRGGLSTSDHSRWANWTGKYANISKNDAIPAMRKMYRKCRFKSPVSIPDFRRGAGDQYRIYCGEEEIRGFEDLGEAQNENLGRDLASMDGQMTFRKNPIVWVPKLDETTPYNYTTYAPIYFVNWAFFYPVFLRGDYLRETGPKDAPNQHNVLTVHVDCTWNILCTDLRCQGVLSKATNRPS